MRKILKKMALSASFCAIAATGTIPVLAAEGVATQTITQKKQPLIFCTNCLRHRWKSLQASAISAALQICLIK